MTIYKAGVERIGRPAFQMDFVNSKQFPGWHNPFIRSSVGTYLNAAGYIDTARNNEPRFDHHPETGTPRGLLLENSQTNYMTDYRFHYATSNPSFSSSNLQQLTAVGGHGGTLSPSGDYSATLYTVDGSNSAHRVISGSNPISGNAQCFSFFVKPNGTNRISLDCDNIGINVGYFLSGDGSIHGSPLNNNSVLTHYGIEKYPNGWYRCFASVSSALSNGGNDWRIYLANNVHHTSFTGNGESVWLWGAQLENSRMPSSLIKATGGSVTRSQDYLGHQGDGNNTLNRIYSISNGGAGLYPSIGQPSEVGQMVYLHGEIHWDWNNGTNYYYFQWDSTGGNEYYGFRIGGSSGVMTLQVYNNGSYNSISLGGSPVQRLSGMPSNGIGHVIKREFVIAASLHPDTGMRVKGRYINPTDNHYYEDAAQLEILSGATNPSLPGNQGYGQLDLFGLVGSGQILRNGHIKCLKFWNHPFGLNNADVDNILTQLVEE
jgi:hypothetical protein